MHLDVATLMAMGSFIAACAGTVLLFAWWQNRDVSALALWGIADIVIAGGILSLILGAVLQQPVGSLLGSMLLVLGPGLMWKAARAFDAKPAPTVVTLLGMVAIGVASGVPGIGDILGLLSLAAGAAYMFAAAITLWLGRNERLAARWPLIIFTAVHATVLLIGVDSTLDGSTGQDEVPSVWSLFGLIHFEQNIFALGTAVFILALVKERSEAASRMAAHIDPLTGIANRAAFMENAGRILEGCRRKGAPISVMMFDLDRFKSVNDTHGHAVGDSVIQKFCEIAASALQPTDIFGRIGGEEFAVVLPGAGAEAAGVRAEQIRAAFAENCRVLGDHQVNATVSGGLSLSMDAAEPLSALLEYSDKALYRAKAEGRNCIKWADRCQPGVSPSTMTRVA